MRGTEAPTTATFRTVTALLKLEKADLCIWADNLVAFLVIAIEGSVCGCSGLAWSLFLVDNYWIFFNLFERHFNLFYVDRRSLLLLRSQYLWLVELDNHFLPGRRCLLNQIGLSYLDLL